MMKNRNLIQLKTTLLLAIVMALTLGCERDLTDDAVPASFSNTAEIFTDTPIGMGSDFYFPYSGSKATAWSVDNTEGYESSASMRIDVPNAIDSGGNYAGAIFRIDGEGRDLTGYDALTFWAKASQGVVIDELGFGEDFGENKYLTTLTNVSLSTAWQKVIIPIPNPSKLTQERGMLRYATGTQNTNDLGYTFWLDEIKFEKLNTIAQPRPKISNGNDETITTFIGANVSVSDLTQTFNLANGQDITIVASPSYFTFTSSNPSVATVNDVGQVSIQNAGATTITASINDVDALGALTLNSLGSFTPALTPTKDAANVISIFSDAYTNVPVDFFNGYWEPYQTTLSNDFSVGSDNILSYTNFNFVGSQFANPTIDASLMSHIHFDVYVPNGISSPQLKIVLRDFGADGADGGGDDTNIDSTFSGSALTPGQWNSIEINISGMSTRNNLGLIVYENLASGLNAFYLDNIYLYNDGSIIPNTPSMAAPTPTQSPTGVISIFSDTYTNVAGSNLNPNWGQNTVVTQESIAGNNTLLYSGLNYQGITLSSNQDVSGKSFLHIDYYTANSSGLNIYLISPGPVEIPYALTVPSSANWTSIDIPLSEFSPVDLTNLFQFKFDGSGDIYIDNIYFH